MDLTMDLYVYHWLEYTNDFNDLRIRIYCQDKQGDIVILEVQDFKNYVYLQYSEPTRELIQIRSLDHELMTRQFLYPTEKPGSQFYKVYHTKPNDWFRNMYRNYKMYEENVSPILKLCSSYDIPTAGWITMTKDRVDMKSNDPIKLSIHEIRRSSLELPPPSPIILAFDMEVYSEHGTRRFPNAKNAKDAIFQISSVILRRGSIDRYLFTLGHFELSDVHVACFDKEYQLLEAFIQHIISVNPQCITGYNIFKFDWPYLLERLHLYQLDHMIAKLGMSLPCLNIVKNDWSSSAYGTQHIEYPDADGRISLDMLLYARREFKLDNYKLETVCHHILNSGKDPITPEMIFDSYRQYLETKDTRLLQDVGKYCVVDSELIVRLFEKLDIWVGMAEMANICCVSMNTLFTKGQQIKVFSQVYKYCTENNYIINASKGGDAYKGATVMKPEPGLYKNVVPFDFNSLYPSIMIAFNIDPSTLTTPDDPNAHKITFTEQDEEFVYYFKKEPQGVLPTILQTLLQARKDVRKRLKTEQDPLMRIVLEKRQLSYKVSANSMYGVLGYGQGMLPLVQGARCVTALGRIHLQYAADHLRKRYGAVIVYQDTDSCYCMFPEIPVDQLYSYATRIEEEMVQEQVFKSPMRLAFEEKIYASFLIPTKKKYLFTYLNRDGTVSEKIDSKGFDKRDMTKFCKSMYMNTVRMLFNEIPLDSILLYFCQELNKCCTLQIPLDQFVITKTFREITEYEKFSKLTHEEQMSVIDILDTQVLNHDVMKKLPAVNQFVLRLASRGVYYQPGDRVSYVLVQRGTTLADYMEDPEYYKKQSLLRLHSLYYIKLITTVFDQLFHVVGIGESIATQQLKLRTTKANVCHEIQRLASSVRLIKKAQPVYQTRRHGIKN